MGYNVDFYLTDWSAFTMPLRGLVQTIITILGAVLGGLGGFFEIETRFGSPWGYIIGGAIALVVVVASVVTYEIRPPEPSPALGKLRQNPSGPRQSGPVFDQGPVAISAYSLREVPLDLNKGERVVGNLTESDRLDFDWFIVDEANLVAAYRGPDYDYRKGATNDRSAEIKWRATKDGPWYLLFDHRYKQYPRKVAVHLRRTK